MFCDILGWRLPTIYATGLGKKHGGDILSWHGFKTTHRDNEDNLKFMSLPIARAGAASVRWAIRYVKVDCKCENTKGFLLFSFFGLDQMVTTMVVVCFLRSSRFWLTQVCHRDKLSPRKGISMWCFVLWNLRKCGLFQISNWRVLALG